MSSIGLDTVKECQTALEQDPMTDADMQLLTAYATVMKRIVLAMNLLSMKSSC